MALRSSERGAGSDPGLSVLDLVRILRRGALFALLLTAAAGGTAYFLTSQLPPSYAARVGVVASQPNAQYGELGLVAPPMVDPGVYQSVILEGGVVSDALLQLNGVRPSERDLENFLESVRVRVENTQMSSLVWIEVRNPSPEFAAAAANEIADQLVLWDRERASRTIERSIAAIEASIANLETELATARSEGDAARIQVLTDLSAQRAQELQAAVATRSNALVVGLLEPLRTAVPPEEPVGPRVALVTLAAALLALALGYAVQLVRWTLDTRIGTRADVMASTGLPVLAEFPRLRRRAARLSAEAAGFFRTNLMLATRSLPAPRVIVVTSPLRPGEKEGVAISLAESFTRSGQRTLLVDADMRTEGVTDWLDLVPASATPLEVFLANPERAFPTVSVALGNKRSFDFIPSFSSERYPVDLINEGFAAHLERWSSTYDVIILDGTPVLPFADALAMAPLATGVVLCVSARRSSREQLDEAVGLLGRTHVKILGIVLTDLTRPSRRRTGAAEIEEEVVEPYRTRVPTSRRPVERAIDAKLASTPIEQVRKRSEERR